MKKKKPIINQELLKVFSQIEGTLIIKGIDNWVAFIEAANFNYDKNSPVAIFKIGGVTIYFSENPKYEVISIINLGGK